MMDGHFLTSSYSKEREVTCKVCGKRGFSTKNNVVKHIKIRKIPSTITAGLMIRQKTIYYCDLSNAKEAI